MVRILQSVPEMRQLLHELRRDWRSEALVHNDVKWDNLLVYAGPDSKRITRLSVVDWEFADLGDPCWDVGAMFGNYLSAWLMSIPITGAERPDHSSNSRVTPWSGCIRRSVPSGTPISAECGSNRRSPSGSWLRAVRYASARLIETCFEYLQTATTLTGNVVCLLQLSLNIAKRPSEAAVHLLGLPVMD